MKSVDQSIYDELFKRCQKLGYKVFEDRPMKEVDYPFVDFEDTEVNPIPNKSNIKGNVNITINVWGLAKKRAEVSYIAEQIFNEANEINQAYGVPVALRPMASQRRILTDNSTNTTLKRAIVELEFSLL